MTAVAKVMLALFIAAWCVAVAAWFYGMRYFIPMWLVGFRKTERHEGYARKALIGAAVFLAAIAVGFAAGGIAQFWGGGWD